ncbi:hypothetical protein L484_002739 [Morus notabilis]|uniref:Uncharacterized protein n=1 Tax=Morus notabilis TaxID=981085 RepID=W9RD96_9ROSA|nr:hypothetical protein L484_002739 [Morus notabilis]
MGDCGLRPSGYTGNWDFQEGKPGRGGTVIKFGGSSPAVVETLSLSGVGWFLEVVGEPCGVGNTFLDDGEGWFGEGDARGVLGFEGSLSSYVIAFIGI